MFGAPESTREQMLGRALRVAERLGTADPALAQRLLDEHFDQLFVPHATGYRPRWPDTVRELLITWEPGRRRAVRADGSECASRQASSSPAAWALAMLS
jgi:hypothetical protein